MTPRQVTKHYYAINNKKEKEWYRLIIDGIKTNYAVNKNGELMNLDKWEVVPTFMLSGYPTYHVVVKGSPVKERFDVGVHRLLAACFIPIPKHFRRRGYDQTMLIPNHKDGIKSHSTLDNLEWVTTRGNAIHAQQTGLLDTYSGENSHLAKITNEDAKIICEELQNGLKPREISEKYGYTLKQCTHIYTGETWKRLSKNYDFSKARSKRITMGTDNLVKKSYDAMERICSENEEINELLHMNDFDNSVHELDGKLIKKKICRHIVTTSSDDKKWRRLIVDGVKTNYEANCHGEVRDRDTKELIKYSYHRDGDTFKLNIPELSKGETSISCERMVASLFIPVPKHFRELGLHAENLVIKFKDGNNHNFDATNLEWMPFIKKVLSGNGMTNADAERICKLLDAGIMPRQISEKTGYSINTIRNIRKGYSWQHVSSKYSFVERYNNERPRVLDEPLIREICEELQSNEKTYVEIAEKLHVTRQVVGDIYRGDAYTNISKEYTFANRDTHKSNNTSNYSNT